MRLIAGLGNPGREYKNTPHNAGFEVVDQLAHQLGLPSPQSRFQGLMQRGSAGPEPFLLLKPQTYMNRSGFSVAECLRFFKIAPEDLVVVSDDLDLPPGRVRLRTSGSHGGHNGLRSIIDTLEVSGFHRLRIGIGGPPAGADLIDFVMSGFAEEEETSVEASVRSAADGVFTWRTEGLEAAMNRFNAVS